MENTLNKDTIRKELRRLSRTELLELMVQQSRELEKARDELAAARAELRKKDEVLSERALEISKLEEKYNKREVRLQNAGSIAEASLVLSGIFEEAQKAADIYLHNVRVLTGYEEPEPVEEEAEPVIDPADAAGELGKTTEARLAEAQEADEEAEAAAEEADEGEAVARPEEAHKAEALEETSGEPVSEEDTEVEETDDQTEDDLEAAGDEQAEGEHVRHRHGRKSRAALRSAAEQAAEESEA